MQTLAPSRTTRRTWSLATHDTITALDADEVIHSLSDDEFALLLRTVDLVVLAQVFSRERLQAALRISSRAATRMTVVLELLEVISTYEVDGQREVLVQLHELPVLLMRLRTRSESAAAVA